MSVRFEELDYQRTPQGELILRRRDVASLGGVTVYEVTLGGEFLMSSLVDDAERALATRPLARLGDRPAHVLVGGLGLGSTAAAALDVSTVETLTVVEHSPAVLGWHRRRVVPLASRLLDDPRCRLLEGDFFRLVAGEARAALPRETFTAILVDIDHSPTGLLDPSHAAFYEVEGLRRLAGRLEPGGLAAIWSADPPEPRFLSRLQAAFDGVTAEEILFRNPLLDVDDRNTIYLGEAGGQPDRS